jgi:hypothetical protein
MGRDGAEEVLRGPEAPLQEQEQEGDDLRVGQGAPVDLGADDVAHRIVRGRAPPGVDDLLQGALHLAHRRADGVREVVARMDGRDHRELARPFLELSGERGIDAEDLDDHAARERDGELGDEIRLAERRDRAGPPRAARTRGSPRRAAWRGPGRPWSGSSRRRGCAGASSA